MPVDVSGTMIDEDQLDCNPDIHGHYCCALRQSTLPIQQHRPLAAQIDSSVRSENSFEDTPIFRHPCRDASCTSHCAAVRRDFGHLKFGDGDADAIQVIGDVELQQLPEAVNREIMKNSREIMYEENVRESEDCHVGGGRASSRKSLPKHGYLDEERRSLNGSRRNLNNRSFLVACDDGRRSLNGSRRNLNNSNRRYLLVALDQSCNSSRNLHAANAENLTATRRHTGSGERLDDIRRSGAATKVAKETPTTTPESGKRRLNNGDVEMHNKVVIESEKVTLRHPNVEEMSSNSRGLPRETNASPRAPTSPLSDLSPESGFFEGNQSSPETARNSNFLGNLKRNRRSYEHAQLQDVNRALSRRNSSSSNSSSSGSSSSDNDGPSKNLLTDVDLSVGQILEAVSPKQTIPYTSV